MTVAIPPALLDQRRLGADWAGWLDRLPRLVSALLTEWQLTPVDDPRHGFCSIVVPVLDADDQPAALKVSFDGDLESEHEGLALQRWGGNGVVRLIRADPRRRALLLHWLPGPDLRDVWDVEACEVVARAYSALHIPAPPQVPRLSSYVERWLVDLARLGSGVPLPRRYVEQAVSLGRELVAEPEAGRLIHADLHYFNVLADREGEWAVIDPKPMSGDPHYEPAPMLWNRMDELEAPAAVESVRDGLRRRFHALVDVAGLDEDRARAWVIVRTVLNAGWSVRDARRAQRDLLAAERSFITRCITVTKAVQD